MMRASLFRLTSATWSALAWFSLGYVIASTHLWNNDNIFTLWNIGEGRRLKEDIVNHGESSTNHEGEHGEREGLEGTDEEHGSHEEKEGSEFVATTSVVCIIFVLIAITIAFEHTKDYIEEKASRAMKPVISSMFGELTVLGFLAVVTFIIDNLGIFHHISIRLFGEHEGGEFKEIFEQVHFALFFVMVSFLLSVLSLLYKAMHLEEIWLEMDCKCQEGDMEKILALERSERDRHNSTEDLIVFHSMREEFIKNRSIEPPFAPSSIEEIPCDFNYGRYLSDCLGVMLGHAVEVRILTWGFFAAFTVVFYIVWISANFNSSILAWIWVAVGYFGLAFDFKLEKYLIKIRTSLAGPLPPEEQTHLGEYTQLVDNGNASLPKWCQIDLDGYMTSERPWLAKNLCHQNPNRQDTLFFLEKLGPTAHIQVLQTNLIFNAVYGAVLVLVFFPEMLEKNWSMLGIYVIISGVPFVTKMLRVTKRMAIMSEVSSVGALRKPQAIATVLRDDKTEMLVRTFVILCKLKDAANSGFYKFNREGDTRNSSLVKKVKAGSIGKTFDVIDKSGDGHISSDELMDLMSSLGIEFTEEELAKMSSMLDVNGDGQISKDEFMQWYLDQIEGEVTTIHHLAGHIFKQIVPNHDGEATITQFKDFLESINVNFTVDEIGSLVMELDADGTGMINLEEFEKLLETYYPHELKK